MTQRDRIVVGVLGAVAAIVGFYFLVLAPQRGELDTLSKDLAKQEQRLSAAKAKVASAEAARRTYASDFATVARLGKAVPVGDQVPSLVYQLQAAANRTGVDFRTMKLNGGGAPTPAASPGPKAGGKPVGASQAAAAVAPPGSQVGSAGFPTLPFAFSFDGNFFRMERFLSVVERFTRTGADGPVAVRGRLLTIDGFAITPSKLSGFPRVNASIAATAYVLPPGEDPLAGATPAGPTPGAPAPGAAPSTPPAGSGGGPTTATLRGATP